MNSFHVVLMCFAVAMVLASLWTFRQHMKKQARRAEILKLYTEHQLELKFENDNFKRKVQAHNRAQGYNEYFEKVN